MKDMLENALLNLMVKMYGVIGMYFIYLFVCSTRHPSTTSCSFDRNGGWQTKCTTRLEVDLENKQEKKCIDSTK